MFGLAACKAQSNESKMREVTQNVITSIQKNDPEMFMRFLTKDLSAISKTKNMVASDVEKFHNLLNTYQKDQKPEVLVTDLYNFLGQRLVRIQIYDNENGPIKTNVLYLRNGNKLYIDLYFGPPDINPLNRLSGYQLVKNDKDVERFKPYDHWRH
jgi:hypothetical protein